MPESTRANADEIYDRVRDDAREELERGPTALGLSGLFAGFTLGATPIAYAAVATAISGEIGQVAASLVYPVGYVATILGRAQLFTENTLYPVLLSLGERRYLVPTARLWAIVLAANLVGALIFASLAVETPALSSAVGEKIVSLGQDAANRGFWTTFWAGVLAGWLLALVAWLVEAAQTAIGVIVVVWLITFAVGLLHLDHSIATAIEVWASVFDGPVGFAEALGWQATAVLGNAAGGVFIVALLNFGQVRSETG